MSHTTSLASSQRHILAPNDDSAAGAAASSGHNVGQPRGAYRNVTPQNLSLPPSESKDGNVSLSVNFLPSKFSRPVSPGGLHKRKKGGKDTVIPKTGGGREAFKSGESRMPGENDDDYDGVENVRATWFGGPSGRKKKLRWNRFKWILFVMNTIFSTYSLVAFIFCLITWFNIWTNADVVRVGNRTELVLSTLAATFSVVTSLIGWSGLLLNNRSFLAVYSFLLWVCFAFIVAPGYITYKRRTFNLEGKINRQWSRDLGAEGRLRIQNQLNCCGYFSPFVEATVSQACYARSMLAGCKNGYMKFERSVLERWYATAFIIVPFHLATIIASLLCSNHVTYRFGKGMTPKAYRLSPNSMAVIMENYANQLADQYGADIAGNLLGRSQSNLNLNSQYNSTTQLDAVPPLPYTPGTGTPPPAFSPAPYSPAGAHHAQYASLGGTVTDGDGKRVKE